ncbi:MAG: APC family permease [Candidatus Limiplasma sp.]|nr:APC family permease [Candidatus Limiplasma sp.]
MSEKSQNSKQQLSKRLRPFDLFTIGFGAIIGVGWILVIGDWIQTGGGPLSTTLAFLVGTLCLYPIARVFGSLTVAMPVAGGAFIYILRAFGRKMAFITGWLLTLAYVMMAPWEIIAIGELAQTLFPALATIPLYQIGSQTVYLPTILLCLGVAGIMIWINRTGVEKVTRLQKLLVVMLLGISVLIIVVALVVGKLSNLQPLVSVTLSNPSGNFWSGFLAVLAMTPFFYSGFDTIGQGAEEVNSTSDKCQIGALSGMSIWSAGAFYCLIIPAVCMVIPWQQMVTLNLPAAEVFSVGHGLYALKILVIIGAFCGLLTTLNSFYVAGARLILSMGREGLLPPAFSKIHPRYQTPSVSNMIIGVLCIVGCFLSKSLLLPIVNVCSLGYMFAWFVVSLAALRFRKQQDLHFVYPVSKTTNCIAVVMAVIMLLLLLIPSSPGALKWPLEIGIVGIWLVLGVVAYAVVSRQNQNSSSNHSMHS